MQQERTGGKTDRLAKIGPVLTVAFTICVVLHTGLYDALGKGKLGPTPALAMFAPLLLYFLASLAVLVVLVMLCIKKRLAAAWYFLSLLVCVGGLVQAWNELANYMEVV